MPFSVLLRRQQRIILVIITVLSVTVLATLAAIGLLYQAAFTNQKHNLVEMVQSQARLVDAVSRFDAIYSQEDHPLGAEAATLSQVVAAHQQQPGFGQTGEFVLGQQRRNNIIYLLPSRHLNGTVMPPKHFSKDADRVMYAALSGKRGVLVADDYRGVEVLAAYEPLKELQLGLVAKVDVAEIRKPFIDAAWISLAVALGLSLVALIPVCMITSPLINQLETLVDERTKALDEANQELYYLAHHDHLTGIANRACFMRKLDAFRASGGYPSLFFIDLDGFKPVNDRYGHLAGDEVLTVIAKRLQNGIRQSDLVARIGGDEFAVLLEDIPTSAQVTYIANEVMRLIREPIQLSGGQEVAIECSIGIALDELSDETTEALISRADTAMYQAKLQPGSCFELA